MLELSVHVPAKHVCPSPQQSPLHGSRPDGHPQVPFEHGAPVRQHASPHFSG
jgi:hypothetical protein